MTRKLIFIFCVFMAGALGVQGQDKTVPYTLTITGPDGITMPGGEMTFTADLSGGSSHDFSYIWTVSEGKIIAGQGTPSITVQVPKNVTGGNVTATVTVVIREAASVEKRMNASETAPYTGIPKAELYDKLSANWSCEEGLARMDNYYIGLNNNPNSQGYVIIFARKSDIKSVLRHRRFLQNSIRFRKFDSSRLTFLTAVSDDPRTEFWLVPPGAEAPASRPSDFDPIKRETKPYIFGLESSDGVAGCEESPYDPHAYADELKGRKDRGKLVIRETSLAKFRRKEREIRDALRDAGVTQSRVRSQFIKVSRPLQASVELWVLPQ